MDEKLHHIDRLFKKAVEQHLELPSSKVWENLEKSLQKRTVSSIYKKYRKWKWVAAALFIFSVALAMYTLHLNLKYKKASEKKHGNETVNDTKSFGNSTGVARNENHQKIVEDLSGPKDENQKAKVENVTTGQPSSNIEKTRNDNSTGKSSRIIKNGGVNPNKIVNSEISDSRTSAAIGTGKRPDNKVDQYVSSKELRNKIRFSQTKQLRANNIEVSGKNISEIVASNKTLNNSPFSSTEKEASTEYLHAANASIVSKNIDLSIGAAQIPANVLRSESSLLPTIETAKTTSKSKAGPFSITLNRGKFTASVYYSQDFISTTMQPNNPDFREDHYLQIKSHEKMRAANVLGFSLVKSLGKKLGIETGASLHTYITDINAKPLVARKDNNGKVNYRISSSSGYAYYAVKNRPTPGLADTLRTISSTSTVQYISIPIGLQYHFYAGRKLSISPAIALSTNILTNGKITTIQSLEHTYISDIEGLKSHYLDGTTRLNICYYLSKRLGVSLVPSSSFALSDATESRPVITRRNALGIAAGLNFTFW